MRSFEALYEGTYDIFHTLSSTDQKGPELFVTNFSAHTVIQDEHQSLCSIFVSIIHENVRGDETYVANENVCHCSTKEVAGIAQLV